MEQLAIPLSPKVRGKRLVIPTSPFTRKEYADGFPAAAQRPFRCQGMSRTRNQIQSLDTPWPLADTSRFSLVQASCFGRILVGHAVFSPCNHSHLVRFFFVFRNQHDVVKSPSLEPPCSQG